MSLLNDIRRRLTPNPIDWERGAGRPAVSRPATVEVIIPIYGAPEVLGPCLRSIAAETDLSRHRATLVLDGPQERAVELLVSELASAHPEAVRVFRNEARNGFVASVNRGMSASPYDVVLLNSDTVVTPRWLEKLVDAAYSSGDAGTVTPLSNHATLCSVPRPFVENLIPAGFDAATFGALVEEVSARSYHRVPTGVGVCFYIRRALIDDIGLFDVERFGLGYGEENDFCMRALARGWLNLVDDATFIYHAGHRSFGATRKAQERRAASLMKRLHPRYMATIAELMRRDPLAPVRSRINGALIRGRGPVSTTHRPKIVHLVHGWPPFQQAGTELYASWLVREQRRTNDVAVYTRAADLARADGEAIEWLDDSVRVRLVTNNFTARNPLRRNAISHRRLERDFERFLKEERPDLLHVHHLAGHAFSLVRVARKLGIPIVLQVQDWWFLCARVNLFDRDGNRCSGPAPPKCSRCATLTKVFPAPFWNRALHNARIDAARAAIAACDVYIAGSEAIRDDYVRAGVIPNTKPFHVIPYGVDIVGPREARPPVSRPIRFGYVGSISPHKGVHLAVEAMQAFESSEATFHIWGDLGALPQYVETLRERCGDADVVFEGRFDEADKPRVFASMDILLVPSIGLESFGLAAREAMTCGVPVIASAGGALSEMFEPGVCGDFFPAGDPAALRGLLRRVVDDPSLVDRWVARLPRPKRSEEHALEIARVYDSVLSERR